MSCCGTKAKTNDTKNTSHEEAICPVCGMNVEPEESPKVTYEGKDYFFCNSNCAERFVLNPKAFFSAT
jgi:YHS domain-containing protein